MIFLVIPILLNDDLKNKILKGLWQFTYLFPSLIIVVGTGLMIYELKLYPILYIFVLAGGALVFWSLKKRTSEQLVVLPFATTALFLLCFALYLPKMETFRPYDEIGRIINEDLKIDPSVPLHIDNTLIHNLPFYAERKGIWNEDIKSFINENTGPILALVKEGQLAGLSDYDSVWNGWIYNSASESQFFKFVMACHKADNGNFSKFAKYHLVIKN